MYGTPYSAAPISTRYKSPVEIEAENAIAAGAEIATPPAVEAAAVQPETDSQKETL